MASQRILAWCFFSLAADVCGFFLLKPLPWYPRIMNLVAPPQLASVALAPGTIVDRLEVRKSERRLVVYSKGKPVKIYYVALSKKPVGHKQYEGDRKVPEGRYWIYDKNPNSKYHKNLGISYPNAQDRAVAASLGKSPGALSKFTG